MTKIRADLSTRMRRMLMLVCTYLKILRCWTIGMSERCSLPIVEGFFVPSRRPNGVILVNKMFRTQLPRFREYDLVMEQGPFIGQRGS